MCFLYFPKNIIHDTYDGRRSQKITMTFSQRGERKIGQRRIQRATFSQKEEYFSNSSRSDSRTYASFVDCLRYAISFSMRHSRSDNTSFIDSIYHSIVYLSRK